MLDKLPAELLWEVWAGLEYKTKTCNAFVQTCRRLYQIFNADFYDSTIRRQRDPRTHPLLSSAIAGREDCIRALLAHGANPRFMDAQATPEVARAFRMAFSRACNPWNDMTEL
ncbi:hypothetical protein BJY00DRAFT_290760 [Aspergillus carlsbadensis]|nr:hypothetical protein BJY00DRAFT_290760 [Aspergillus carlsbadensis]